MNEREGPHQAQACALSGPHQAQACALSGLLLAMHLVSTSKGNGS